MVKLEESFRMSEGQARMEDMNYTVLTWQEEIRS